MSLIPLTTVIQLPLQTNATPPGVQLYVVFTLVLV